MPTEKDKQVQAEVPSKGNTSLAEVNDRISGNSGEEIKQNRRPVEAIAAHTIGIHQARRWNR